MASNNKRRELTDRRDDDIGPPPGWKDRRRRTERRIPEIEEQVISESEWMAYFGNPLPVNPVLAQASEAAASALDRVRE